MPIRRLVSEPTFFFLPFSYYDDFHLKNVGSPCAVLLLLMLKRTHARFFSKPNISDGRWIHWYAEACGATAKQTNIK